MVLIAAGVLTIRFIFGGSEDSWICVDDQWVKHGNPSAPKPITQCGTEKKEINSFDDCLTAGSPAMESYPRQCRWGNKIFVEDIGDELEKIDLIRVDSPKPNQTVESPLQITGQARGYWFFEASFPVKLVAEDGEILAMGIAQAQTDWMTEDFVAFELELTFDPANQKSGTLILERDNPSGLPENADELQIPVYFQ